MVLEVIFQSNGHSFPNSVQGRETDSELWPAESQKLQVWRTSSEKRFLQATAASRHPRLRRRQSRLCPPMCSLSLWQPRPSAILGNQCPRPKASAAAPFL